MNTAKDTTVKWAKDMLDGTPSTFSWSPDSKKVLFRSAQINIPSGTAAGVRNTTIAYLDIGKKTVTTLQTVSDQSKNTVTYLGWLDNNTVVYNQLTINTNDFAHPAYQAYKQSLNAKAAAKLDNRQLISVYRY